MAEAAPTPVLACENLTVAYRTGGGPVEALSDISFAVGPGEAYGLVGESGCGKSTAALAIMRHLGANGAIAGGRILFEGSDLASLGAEALRTLRGRRIAMVYQDPMASLNPVMPVGRQVTEVMRVHNLGTEAEAKARALQVLAEVELPDPATIFDRYPHQLSGGQQQRVVIAMALMAEPTLLIMDEPTTGLDVTVEAAVLDLVDRLRRRRGAAVLFISHNLGAVRRLCDRIGVLYAGRLMEQGAVDQVFRTPAHPYTRGLLASVPVVGADCRQRPLKPIRGALAAAARRIPGCAFADRCDYAIDERCRPHPIALAPVGAGHDVRCVRAGELPPAAAEAAGGEGSAARRETHPVLEVVGIDKTFLVSSGVFGTRGRRVRALEDIDLTVRRGRTLAIVGESGSGKSTLARVLMGLTTAEAGEARLGDSNIAAMPIEKRPANLRKRLQMVFQNPDSTLNPSHTVGYALERTLGRLRGSDRRAARGEARKLLELVQLPADFAERMPDQISGGQKQRVAIARALAGEPEIVIADEPVSALDVSVQAAIVNLLNDLQARLDVSLVFISHDLALVRYMADDVALMYRGRVVEVGPVERVFGPPFHPYTQTLLAAAPTIDPDAPRARGLPKDPGPLPEGSPNSGCPFAPRCTYRIIGVCDVTPPPDIVLPEGHRIACHLEVERLPAGI